jgi:hypothetical protein
MISDPHMQYIDCNFYRSVDPVHILLYDCVSVVKTTTGMGGSSSCSSVYPNQFLLGVLPLILFSLQDFHKINGL